MLPDTASTPMIVAVVNAELAQLHPRLLGWKHDGTNITLRFRAALDSPWVYVHIQSTGTGGATYTPGTSISSTKVDCRASRIQDRVIADIPAERIYVFLIPTQEDGAGNEIKYDGQSGRPDHMAFADIGV